MVWGEPTWFFLHAIAHKVKDESFNKIRLDLLKNIYTVCCNLPCPTCSQHAKQHKNLTNIKNKRNKQTISKKLKKYKKKKKRKKKNTQIQPMLQ
jgi:biotin synthase-like enzyme